MASGNITRNWVNFYTNHNDHGGAGLGARHWGAFEGTWSTVVTGGYTELTVRVRAGMYIDGNATGSSYFQNGAAMTDSAGKSSGLISNNTYQWAFNMSASDNTGQIFSGGRTWQRVNHIRGLGEQGWSEYITFTHRYTQGGTYRVTIKNDIIDSPNHMHQTNEISAVTIDVVIEDPDYRPGQRAVNGVLESHNRDGGLCHRMVDGAMVEMRTKNGHVDTDNPPRIMLNNILYNQEKVGSGAILPAASVSPLEFSASLDYPYSEIIFSGIITITSEAPEPTGLLVYRIIENPPGFPFALLSSTGESIDVKGGTRECQFFFNVNLPAGTYSGLLEIDADNIAGAFQIPLTIQYRKAGWDIGGVIFNGAFYPSVEVSFTNPPTTGQPVAVAISEDGGDSPSGEWYYSDDGSPIVFTMPESGSYYVFAWAAETEEFQKGPQYRSQQIIV